MMMATATPIKRSLIGKIFRFVLLLLLAVLLVLVFMAFVPLSATTQRIDFTRFVSAPATGGEIGRSFFAQAGPGRLLAAADCVASSVSIRLNGDLVQLPASVKQLANKRLAVPVALGTRNEIQIASTTDASICSEVRVKQNVTITTHALSRVHFNTNVSDFVAAREFYGSLGFSTVSGFPDTNTQAMARAIGITTPTTYDGSKGDHAGGYLLHGELVGPGGFAGGVIDLIEFTIPRSSEPPYRQLNHLGMARAVMHTDDLQASWKSMSSLGVKFVSEPVFREGGGGFAIFKDLDGARYELRQSQGSSSASDAAPDSASESVGITRLGAVNVNVSDLERSVAWYQMLGFTRSGVALPAPNAREANALGFDAPVQLQGEAVRHSIDSSTLELVQWLEPFDESPPYALPVNHLGIHRMAFATSDIEADVATLTAQGVAMVSPITPCCSGDDSWGSIIAFKDPDGAILELVEQPMMTPLITLSVRLNRLSGI